MHIVTLKFVKKFISLNFDKMMWYIVWKDSLCMHIERGRVVIMLPINDEDDEDDVKSESKFGQTTYGEMRGKI